MINAWIVMPAYNAGSNLEKTYNELPFEYRSRVILVDDCSVDDTVLISEALGIVTVRHDRNLGYGGNQKTCYAEALKRGADVVVMVHPDHQYDPRVVGIMSELISLGNCDIVLGNRIRTRREALSGGMPHWRYFLNRSSTFVENLLLGQTIGDFHSGLRAYSRETLEKIPFELNSNDFAFDQQLLVQAVALKLRIADIPIPARYEDTSSSISFKRSLKYGVMGAIAIFQYFLHRLKILPSKKFLPKS
jgi:glycosyltransferase involved in cell wall biosynthesis